MVRICPYVDNAISIYLIGLHSTEAFLSYSAVFEIAYQKRLIRAIIYGRICSLRSTFTYISRNNATGS